MTALRVDLTEAEFLKQIMELATILGWRCVHFRPARTQKGWRTAMQGDPGFPDLVLAKKGKIVIAELKSEKGKLTDEQRAWLDEMLDGLAGHPFQWDNDELWPRGVDCMGKVFLAMWRPSDFDEIQRVLQGDGWQ